MLAPNSSIANFPLELLIVKKYHDHPFLQVNQRASKENYDSNKERDGRFTGVLLSLKERNEQKEYDKKRRTTNSTIGEDDTFKLQAATSNCQIAVAESKNMIEFLRMAQGSSVWDK